MWRIEGKGRALPPDVARCLEALNGCAAFFDSGRSTVLARAPGRLDLMGGIADYSGSLVLQMPLEVAAFVAAQVVDEPVVRIRSLEAAAIGGSEEVDLPLEALAPPAGPLSYQAAHELLASDPQKAWAAYVAGVVVVLQREEGVRFERGLRLLVYSEVPAGKGVSSSAALEVAAMQAVCGVLDVSLPGRRAALLCQTVENVIVGAPCGVMDQTTAACGEEGRLLALLCQPVEIQPAVTLPSELAVWGIDSGVRHAVSGRDYGTVRAGAFMGYRMIAALEGLPVEEVGPGRVRIADARWGGYLCNVTPKEWETRFRDRVPGEIRGDEFLGRCGGTTDSATTIEPGRIYPVRQATAHPIYEHERVRLFSDLLGRKPLDEKALGQLGELMYQSHASYAACGLGEPGTDRIVALVREAGPASGLYGAKITGGGSGGTVAVLAHREAYPVVREVARRYGGETGRAAAILGGFSPGAEQFGVLTLRHEQG